MKCPFCTHLEDKVVDSRESKEGEVIRRRREGLECGKRLTSYERIDEIRSATAILLMIPSTSASANPIATRIMMSGRDMTDKLFSAPPSTTANAIPHAASFAQPKRS